MLKKISGWGIFGITVGGVFIATVSVAIGMYAWSLLKSPAEQVVQKVKETVTGA